MTARYGNPEPTRMGLTPFLPSGISRGHPLDMYITTGNLYVAAKGAPDTLYQAVEQALCYSDQETIVAGTVLLDRLMLVFPDRHPGAYLTTFCNQFHRFCDGKPIDHECYVLYPSMLELERREIEYPSELARAWRLFRSSHRGVRCDVPA